MTLTPPPEISCRALRGSLGRTDAPLPGEPEEHPPGRQPVSARDGSHAHHASGAGLSYGSAGIALPSATSAISSLTRSAGTMTAATS